MSFLTAISLATAMLILAASPGPGVFATIARAMASGFKPALYVVAGIVIGDIIYLFFAVFGMAFIAKTMGEMFFIVKICGGLYLIYLGIKIWRSDPVLPSATPGKHDASSSGNLLSGLLITLSNPKVIVFYCSFLPTFLDLSALNATAIGTAAAIVAAVLGGVMTVYAYLASRARQILKTRRAVHRMNQTAGSVMTVTGVVLTLN